MQSLLIAIKFISLFIAVMFSINNTTIIFYKQSIPYLNFVLQALGIVAFIFIQFEMYL